jgi:hypothetical protein
MEYANKEVYVKEVYGDTTVLQYLYTLDECLYENIDMDMDKNTYKKTMNFLRENGKRCMSLIASSLISAIKADKEEGRNELFLMSKIEDCLIDMAKKELKDLIRANNVQ